MSRRSHGPPLVIALLLSAPEAFAGQVPLRNWAVPTGPGALSALGDLGNLSLFVPVTPCRLVDTRAGSGFTGEYGAPALVAGVVRTINVVASVCTGIPSDVTAFSLNLTVTNAAGPGNLRAWPAGFAMPGVSTLNYVQGETAANAAVVPAGWGTSIAVRAGVSSTDVIIDINGYFTNYPNLDNRLFVYGSFTAEAAIAGFNLSNVDGSNGIDGYAGGTGVVYGAEGKISPAAAAFSAGVHGIGSATSQRSFGVSGESAATANGSAGVFGLSMAGTPPVLVGGLTAAAGVRGEGGLRGVVGVAGPTGVGIRGYSLDADGGIQTHGSLGFGTTYGVYSVGDLGATGTKSFVEPHPTDPARVIRFVSLEGPEAGTYFRGTGATEGGVCVIDVPESFRMVTAEDGLTVQVTPVGTPARTWIESESLERIVVRSSVDTRFHYLVQGVRRAFRDFEPIAHGDEFMPSSPDDRLPRWLPEEGRRRLVTNGTFHPDGSVNLETADRLGWTKVWREAREGAR